MRDFILTPKVDKFLRKLKEKHLIKKFRESIDKIRENPYIGKYKVGDLKDILCLDVYYVGINYEIAYKVIEENGEIIYIILIGVRGNFYEELKRYLKELNF